MANALQQLGAAENKVGLKPRPRTKSPKSKR